MDTEDPEHRHFRALLQEQEQYRQEVRMFDAHFFRVMLTYITGLVAAFGWLGTQIIQRAAIPQGQAPSLPLSSAQLGAATTAVLLGLSQGPFFYFFSAIPLITALMFLFVARDWASLHERFGLLKSAGERLAPLVGESLSESPTVFLLDRGHRSPIRTLRAAVEITLVIVWIVGVLGASITILRAIRPYAVGDGRQLWWGTGLGALVLTGAGALVALALFLVRGYRSSRRPAPNVGD